MLEVLFIIAYTLSTAWIAALCGMAVGDYLVKRFHL